MNFEDMLSSLDIYNKPYKFPCEEYNIIGDTAEIDKILYAAGIMNIDVRDIEKTLSKETTNYVSTGSAEGAECVIGALKDAVRNLPIEIDRISNLLLNIWIPESKKHTEIPEIMDFFVKVSVDIDDFCCIGIAIDESLKDRQAKVSLIAASI